MLSICIPTKGRGELVSKLIYRIVDTVDYFDYEIVLAAHPDDSNKTHLVNLPNTCHVHYLECTPIEGYNYAASKAVGNMLMSLDDDSWPKDRWLHHAMECFYENGSPELFMIKLQGDENNPHSKFYWAERSIVSRKFCQTVLGGVLEVPKYVSQRADIEKSDRAINAGVFFNSKGIIEHHHWLCGHPMDNTYIEGQIKYQQIDLDTYNDRKNHGFPTDYIGFL